MQILRPFLGCQPLQLFPERLVCLVLGKADIPQQGLNIETGSSRYEGDMSSLIDASQCFLTLFLEDHYVEIFVRFTDIDQVVQNPIHFSRFDFRGADVHVSVDLHGVSRNDLSVYRLCQGNGKLCFSDGGRSRQYNHRFHCLSTPICRFTACKSPVYQTIRLNFFSISSLVMTTMVGLPWGQL